MGTDRQVHAPACGVVVLDSQPLIAIAGTWGWKSPWWKAGSLFWAYMKGQGIEQLTVAADDHLPEAERVAFEWSTDLGNSWKFWQSRRSQWEAGASSLLYFVNAADVPEGDVVIVAHSHGGQVALLAAARGLCINRLVTIGTPVRADLAEAIAKARPNIKQWWHVCDAKSDKTAWWGAFGDRHFWNRRDFPQADRNIRLDRIAHSKLLNNVELFDYWELTGLVAFLKGRS
jgi:pimeloyl-ACP methyl ester carboxylesterase